MRRIALFGGSFNPPHLGHVLCATYAHAIASIDEVWVLPVHHHPYGKDLLPFADRWAMCEAAFRGLSFVRLRDDERHNPQGRTWDLLQQLSSAHPDVAWHLIGGTDTRDDLSKWYRGKELIEALEIIAIPRRGFDDDHPAALPAISSTQVRERCRDGKTIHDIVPQGVATYITNNNLYAGA